MWSFTLRNPVNFKAIFSTDIWRGAKAATGQEEVLIVEDYVTAFSTFKTVQPTTVSTTRIATPKASGTVAVTDILLSIRKKTNAIVTLQFNDGTNQEILYSADVTNEALYLTHTVKGRMQGWKDAYLELIISGANVDTNCTIVYLKLPLSTLDYTDWDALR